MSYVVFLILWLGVGAAVGVVEARHGHWRKGWVVSAFFGPFAIPLALYRRQVEPPDPVVVLSGRALRGPVDVLVGLDGSESALAGTEAALGLLGSRVHRVTLATVLDVDAAAPHADDPLFPEPYPDEIAARELLDFAARRLRASLGLEPGSVVLAGEPAEALRRFAMEQDYDLIVAGRRGRGLSKLVLGSCASKLACIATVPVLLMPAVPAPPVRRSPSPLATKTASP